MAANKIRVKVRGSVAKSVRIGGATAAMAVLGVNVALPNGQIPSLTQLAALLQTPPATNDNPGNIINPGQMPVVIFSQVQYIPPNVLYPARFVQNEEDSAEDTYHYAVPGPSGTNGRNGRDGRDADDAEDPLMIPGPAGRNGINAGPPIVLWPDDVEDPMQIPGPQGQQGIQGIPGIPGVGGSSPVVVLQPEEGEDYSSWQVPGPAGKNGTNGANGLNGMAIWASPEEQDDLMQIPGPQGIQGLQGIPGTNGASTGTIVLFPDDADDFTWQRSFSWSDISNKPGSANPSAQAGMTAVNGTALTFMTSDSAPAINPGIIPTWTGTHTFSAAFTNIQSLSLDGNIAGPNTAFAYTITAAPNATYASSGYIQLYGSASGNPYGVVLSAGGVANFSMTQGGISISGGTSEQLRVTGTAGNSGVQITGSSTSGQSYGLYVNAGTTSVDNAANIANLAGTTFLLVGGDGHGYINTVGGFLTWSVGGNWVFSAPTSGIGVTMHGVSGGQALEVFGSGTTGGSFGIYVAAGTNSSDQSFNVSNASGANYMVIFGDGHGSLSGGSLSWGALNGTFTATGLVTAAEFTTTAEATSAWQFDFTGAGASANVITMANNTTVTLPVGSGIVYIAEENTGVGVAVAYCFYGSAAVTNVVGAMCTGTSGNAGTVNIYYNGTNAYVIQNLHGSSLNLRVSAIKLRASA